MPSTSSRSRTARAPGISSEGERSSAVTRPRAIGARTIAAYSIPGRLMSAVYTAAPVTFSSASMRGTHCPTTCIGVSAVHGAGSNSGTSTMRVSSRPSTSTFVVTKRLRATRHSPSGVLHREHDLRVRAAAAEVAAQCRPNLRLARARLLVEQRGRRDDLSGCAESALYGIVRDECLLQRVQLAVPKSLDRRHRRLIACGGERQARVHGSALRAGRGEKDRAGAAFAAPAG